MSTQYKTKQVYVTIPSVICDGCGKERSSSNLLSFAEFCSYFDISTRKVINSMHSCSPACYNKVKEMAKAATVAATQNQRLKAALQDE